MRQHFKFHPSLYLALMLCCVHGAVLATLPLLALPAWSRLLLAGLVLLSLVYRLWRDACLRAPDSCRELLLQEGGAVLTLRNGKLLRGAVAQDSLVTPYLTVLIITLPSRHVRRGVTVLPDSLDGEAFRQLRLWLKWKRQEERPDGVSMVGAEDGNISG